MAPRPVLGALVVVIVAIRLLSENVALELTVFAAVRGRVAVARRMVRRPGSDPRGRNVSDARVSGQPVDP